MDVEEIVEVGNLAIKLVEVLHVIEDALSYPMTLTELREYIRWMTGHLNQIVAEI
jgi:hypothetical protein